MNSRERKECVATIVLKVKRRMRQQWRLGSLALAEHEPDARSKGLQCTIARALTFGKPHLSRVAGLLRPAPDSIAVRVVDRVVMRGQQLRLFLQRRTNALFQLRASVLGVTLRHDQRTPAFHGEHTVIDDEIHYS